MVEVAKTFRDVLDGRGSAEGASGRLSELYPGVAFANGFVRGQPGFPLRVSPGSIKSCC
jgi:O2-independent ubiquinone biosynthesis protein UbiV